MNFEVFCVLTVLALFVGGGVWVGVQLERYETCRKNHAAQKTAALVKTSERLTYLERINLAKDYIEKPNDPVAQALILSRKSENESFYARDWTIEEAQEQLRFLAKDLEMAEVTPVPQKSHTCKSYSYDYCEACAQQRKIRQTCTQAVSLELLDSVGDLERKAQHLLNFLMKADYSAFIFAVTQAGMKELADKFELGTKIKRDLQELQAATLTNLQIERERAMLEVDILREQYHIATLRQQIETLDRQVQEKTIPEQVLELHAYIGLEQELCQLFPEMAEEIRSMIENKRLKLMNES